MGHLSIFVSNKNSQEGIQYQAYSTLGTQWVHFRGSPSLLFYSNATGVGSNGCEVYGSTGLICHIMSHQEEKKGDGSLCPSSFSFIITNLFTLQLHRASEMFGNHQVSHSRLWSEPGAASSNPSETGTDLPAQRGAGGLDGKGSKILDSGNCC